MSSRPFVHLHCHSHYSLLDGASKLPALVQRAKALGMPALALTDHGNLYGAVEFLREAKAAGLKPIIGIEAYVAPGRRTERAGGGASGKETSFHLTLLARNGEGVRNLLRLSSMSFLEGFYYKPRIDKEILAAALRGPDLPLGLRLVRVLRPHPPRQDGRGRAALRLVSEGLRRGELLRRDPGQRRRRSSATTRQAAIDLARRMGLPLVGTSDAHYLTREDAAGARHPALHQHRHDASTTRTG